MIKSRYPDLFLNEIRFFVLETLGFGWTNGVILYLADKLPEIDLDSKCHSD